jgi:hypothetical protein
MSKNYINSLKCCVRKLGEGIGQKIGIFFNYFLILLNFSKKIIYQKWSKLYNMF